MRLFSRRLPASATATSRLWGVDANGAQGAQRKTNWAVVHGAEARLTFVYAPEAPGAGLRCALRSTAPK